MKTHATGDGLCVNFSKRLWCFNSIRLLATRYLFAIFFIKNYEANKVLEWGKGGLR